MQYVTQLTRSYIFGIYREKLKSTGKGVRFFAILHDKLLNRESKMSGTVRVKTLERKWFNKWECPAYAHLYTAEFWLNYARCVIIPVIKISKVLANETYSTLEQVANLFSRKKKSTITQGKFCNIFSCLLSFT